MSIKSIIDGIVVREGGYSDNPLDSGGPTMYGITQTVARVNGYKGAIKDLPKEFAYKVYENQYVNTPQFNRIAPISEAVADEVIDCGVNCGPSVAATILQESLNVLNRDQQDYTDIVVDGQIGRATTASLTAYLEKRKKDGGEAVLLKCLNILQGAKYIAICKAKPSQESFCFGWIRNRINI